MAAQSGIVPTAELTTIWATALSSSTTRLLKITIDKEQLVPAAEFESKGEFEGDFQLFEQEGVVEDKVPGYYLYRLEPTPTSQWIFYSYVPDAAPVRSKMLYASSRAALTRALGDERFSTSVFATNKADLTHPSYLSHLSHLSSEAPLTQREQEMAEIRKAEAKEQREGLGSGEARSMLAPIGAGAGGAAVGLEWSEEARGAVQGLGERERDGGVVQLEIEKERVVLSAEQPTKLSLPASSPSYTFYNHPSGLVFIYSCPPTSPIKSRLIYSSSSSGVVQNAKQLGVTVLKKIETSDPAEIDDDYILSELGPLATTTSSSSASAVSSAPGSGASTPLGSATGEKPAFARPSRPGRR